jgi:hypothetical protein
MPDRFTRGLGDCYRNKGARIGTLWSAKKEVLGDVTLSLDFDKEDVLTRMSLLRDFINALTRELNLVCEEEREGRK